MKKLLLVLACLPTLLFGGGVVNPGGGGTGASLSANNSFTGTQTYVGPLSRSNVNFLTLTNQYGEPPFIMGAVPGSFADNAANPYTDFSAGLGFDPDFALANSRGAMFLSFESRYQLNNVPGAASTVSEWHLNFNPINGSNHRPITVLGHWDNSGESVGLQSELTYAGTSPIYGGSPPVLGAGSSSVRLWDSSFTSPIVVRDNLGNAAFSVNGSTGVASFAKVGTLKGASGTGVAIGDNTTGSDNITLTTGTGYIQTRNSATTGASLTVDNTIAANGPLIRLTKSDVHLGSIGTQGSWVGSGSSANFGLFAANNIVLSTNSNTTEQASLRTNGSFVVGPAATADGGGGSITASANIIALGGTITGGAAGLTFNAGGTNQSINLNPSGTNTQVIVKGNGAYNFPALAFSTESGMGMWRETASGYQGWSFLSPTTGRFDFLGVNAAGTAYTYADLAKLQSNIGLQLLAADAVAWSPSTSLNSTADTKISRAAAAVTESNNGTAGTLGAHLASRNVAAKTTNYSVVTADKSTLFTNTGASGTVNFTLPAAAVGNTYTFSVEAAQTLTVTAVGTDTIRQTATVSAAAGNISSGTIGNVVTITCTQAGKWVVTSHEGTWTVT